MVARAADLCGMDTGMDAAAVRDTLSPFGDYVRIAQWAREGVAFCYDSGIWDNSSLDIQPAAAIRRCEIAQTLFGLLGRAGLL